MEVTYKMNRLQHLHQKVTLTQASGHRWGSRLALLILASLSWPGDHVGELPGAYPLLALNVEIKAIAC